MKKKPAGLLVCLCVFLVLCYFFGVLLPHTHECSGENCAICSFFELLRNVPAAAALSAVSIFSADILCKTLKTEKEAAPVRQGTLILLKVKLSR